MGVAVKMLFLIVIIFCSGCNTISVPLNDIHTNQTDNVNFKFIDHRPDAEKVFRPLTKENNSHYYGDSSFKPDRMATLHNYLVKRFGKKLNGHEIAVTKFEFVAFIPGLARDSETAGIAGAISGVVGGLIAEYYKKDYTHSDLFISILEAKIDGKRIIVKKIKPVPGLLDLAPAKNAAKKLVSETMSSFAWSIKKYL